MRCGQGPARAAGKRMKKSEPKRMLHLTMPPYGSTSTSDESRNPGNEVSGTTMPARISVIAPISPHKVFYLRRSPAKNES